MNIIEPGTRVIIVRDVRKDVVSATGQVGVYEGETVFCVQAMDAGEWKELKPEVLEQEWFCSKYPKCDKDFLDELQKRTADDPMPDSFLAFNEVAAWYKKHNVCYHFVDTAPRIRLEDGSFIFGYQCWWDVATHS